MFRIIPRHNINLDTDEILTILYFLRSEKCREGDAVHRFEDDLAAYHGLSHAVALGSARSALYEILKALDLPDSSEVIVPAYSFFTIPEVVRAAGLKPVFARCHPQIYALDPEHLEDAISEKSSAIIVEHPYGQPAPMKEIMALAKHHGLRVIEDISQSIGAKLDGQTVGAFSDAACMSMVHGKNLMTFGGGVVLTNHSELYGSILKRSMESNAPDKSDIRKNALGGLAQWLASTRAGFTLGPFAPFFVANLINRRKLDDLFDEPHQSFSPNATRPLSNLQAALGILQLERLDRRNAIRRERATRIIAALDRDDNLRLPELVPGALGTFNALPVRVADGEAFQRALLIHGIDTRRDYMTVFDFKEEWQSHGDVVYLPCHPGMSEGDADYLVLTCRRLLEG